MKFVFTLGGALALCILTGAIVVYPDGSISFGPLIGFIESVLPPTLGLEFDSGPIAGRRWKLDYLAHGIAPM